VALAKAILQWTTIIPKRSGKLECQFNPDKLTISKGVAWNVKSQIPSLNAPKMSFTGGESATYSLALFFDARSGEKKDVRYYTDQLFQLTLRGGGQAKAKQKNAAPPTVTFVWGKIKLFRAVVKSVSVTYTMFTGDGTPVRATADVSFIQKDQGDDVIPSQNPTSRSDPRKTYIVHAGERLDQIAYEEYNDARYWRLLAEANNLDNPFQLTDGQVLALPHID